jgi:threonine/homoserine/homoserine lactone efflux protein
MHSAAIKEVAFGPAFRRGLMTDLSNPKTVMAFVGIFAVAFPAHPSLSLSILSVTVISAISVSWHCMLASLFARPTFRQTYQRLGRWIDRVAGGLISSFGIALAATGL